MFLERRPHVQGWADESGRFLHCTPDLLSQIWGSGGKWSWGSQRLEILCTRQLKCVLISAYNYQPQVLNSLFPLENGENEISTWESCPKVTSSGHLLLGWGSQLQPMKSRQRKLASGSPLPTPRLREDGGRDTRKGPSPPPGHRTKAGSRGRWAGTSPVHLLLPFLLGSCTFQHS